MNPSKRGSHLYSEAMETLLPEALVADVNHRFENAPAAEIIAWGLEESGLERVAVASSFQAEGTVIIDMAVKVRPRGRRARAGCWRAPRVERLC